MNRVRAHTATGGFSLLEMLVAISVLSLALGMLYQAASGATRNVRSDEKYAYGVELARSLLAEHDVVPTAGVSRSGKTEGGFSWRVASSALQEGDPAIVRLGLQSLEVRVSWQDGLRERAVVLNTVVQGWES